MRFKKLGNNKAAVNRKSDSFTRRYYATKLYHKHRIILGIQFPRALSLPARVAGRGGNSTRVERIQFYILLCFTYSAVLCIVLFWGPVAEYRAPSRHEYEYQASRKHTGYINGGNAILPAVGLLAVPASGCWIGSPYNMQQSI